MLLNALSCWYQAYHVVCAFTSVATPNRLAQSLVAMMGLLFHTFVQQQELVQRPSALFGGLQGMCSADPSLCMWLLDMPDVHLRREIRDHQKFLAVHVAATLLLLACHVGCEPNKAH